MIEEVLPGEEITITVMPKGHYMLGEDLHIKPKTWALPPVRRFNHIDHVAPYNGNVAVIQSSSFLRPEEAQSPSIQAIIRACEKAADIVEAQAPIRIDCRQDSNGVFTIFDLNMNPNLTGPGRPGREDKTCLVGLVSTPTLFDGKPLDSDQTA